MIRKLKRQIKAMVSSARETVEKRRTTALLAKGHKLRLASAGKFIGVTGSSAKSTTSALIGHILLAKGRVATQADSNVAKALAKTLTRSARTSDFVVTELGVGKPGRMQPMAAALAPDIAVVTLIALEHLGSFGSHEAIALEKGGMVEAIRPGGLAVLNADDPHVMGMASRTKERIVTFGRSAGADFRATNISAGYPGPLSLTVEWRGGRLDLKSSFLAEHFWLAVTAACAVAIELGVAPDAVAKQVASFRPILNRFGLLSVPNGPDFILDTVKAPLHSLELAFDAMATARAPRKRILLGTISDFTGNNRKYRDAYRAALKSSDQVMFIGEHAHRSKATEEEVATGRFKAFIRPRDVADHIRSTAVPGELILLKGSGSMHLERIALSWVEDVQCWVPACGRSDGCLVCGLYRTPFDDHKGRKNWKRRRIVSSLLQPWRMLRRNSETRPD